MSFDTFLFQWIHSFSGVSSALDWCMLVIAQYLPYAAALFVLALIAKESRWKERIHSFLVLTFALLLSKGIFVEIIHYFYARPRPFLALGFTPMFPESSNSFPSSHATVLITLAYFAYTLNKRAGIWLFVFALLNGFARVYAGVHWPLDIVGGFAVGLVSFWLTLKAFPARAAAPRAEHEEAHN